MRGDQQHPCSKVREAGGAAPAATCREAATWREAARWERAGRRKAAGWGREARRVGK
jgi:hypothetical protein